MEVDHAPFTTPDPILTAESPEETENVARAVAANKPSTAELVERAIASNNAHKAAVAFHLDQLCSELEQITNALAQVEVQDNNDTPDSAEPVIFVQAPGATRPAMYFAQNEFTNKESPFAEDAGERNLYLSLTTPNALSKRELDILLAEVGYDWERARAHDPGQAQGASSPIENDRTLSMLNWVVIAEKFNSVSAKRKPDELRLAYIAAAKYHNKSPWSAKEKAALAELVEGYRSRSETVDWTKVSDELGTHRLPMDCMRAAAPRSQFRWTPDKDQLLQQNVMRWGDNNWSTVAFHTSPYLNATQAASRYGRLNQKSGRWSPAEDKRLREAYRLFEGSYASISPYLEGRTNEQCRDHWNDIKDNPKKRKKQVQKGPSKDASGGSTSKGPAEEGGSHSTAPLEVSGKNSRAAKKRKVDENLRAAGSAMPTTSVEVIDLRAQATVVNQTAAGSSGATADGEAPMVTLTAKPNGETAPTDTVAPRPQKPRPRPRKQPQAADAAPPKWVQGTHLHPTSHSLRAVEEGAVDEVAGADEVVAEGVAGRLHLAVSYAFVAEEEEESKEEDAQPMKAAPARRPRKKKGEDLEAQEGKGEEQLTSTHSPAGSKGPSGQATSASPAVEPETTLDISHERPPLSRSGMSIASLLN
ncbi:hypothetical protein HDZ31DRAFT_65980 [Schizophyllum fasciatum]